MRSRYLKLVVTLIAVIGLIPVTASPASAGPLLEWRGEVIRVSDGDTFDVRLTNGSVRTVRVAGINTNELARDPNCWADEATERLEELVLGRTVKLRARDAGSRLQGRDYRHVIVGRTNVAEKLLKEGYGIPFLAIDETDYAERYTTAFYQAHDAGLRMHDPDACGVGPAANIGFLVNGDADGNDNENPNGEYVQIRNHGTTTLSMAGWVMHDSAVDYWEFPNSASIPPGGRLTIHAGNGTNTSTRLYMGFDKQLYGPYDGAFLMDPDGDLRAFQHWPCDGLCGDGAIPDVVISEIQYDGPGNDSANPNVEWFRVTNEDNRSVDLQDWRFTSHPYVLHPTGSHVLAPGESLTVYVGQGSDSRTELYWGKTASILNNEGDAVAVWTPDGDVADCRAWGDSDKCSETPALGHERNGSDFDGDGYDDLAIGIPKDDPKSSKNSGSVLVVPGSASGIDRGDGKIWSQAGSVAGKPNRGDKLGSAVATGDFDGDGYDDLAAGVPAEDIDGQTNAGSVNVLYGTRRGLRSAGNEQLRQGGAYPGSAEAYDAYGSALAVGDFDGDGYDDVAIGSPGENDGAGQVDVVYGSSGGLVSWGTQGFAQTGAESGDRYGSSLAAGDFDGDGYDDLAIGSPGENGSAGQVDLLRGSPGRLSPWTAFAQGTAGDRFGHALAAGDLDGDGEDDLAVGMPNEDLGGATNAGQVAVYFGATFGLDTGSPENLNQSNVSGTPAGGDKFGQVLAIGDIDGDLVEDLVVGVPLERRDGLSKAGVVQVVYGRAERNLASSRDSVFDQGNADGTVEKGDRFGAAVAVLDVNGDGRGDIVVGATHEDISGAKNHGAVGVIFGRSAGQSPPRGGLSVDQSGSVPGSPRKADNLGSAVGG